MITVQDFYNAIDRLAPFATAEQWDNVGILVGSGGRQVKKALVALDATIPVIEEAVQAGADLVITHHPVIFHPLKAVGAESTIWKLVQAGISVISAHTNLDKAAGGVNDALADALGLQGRGPLSVASRMPYRKVVVFVPRDHAEKVYDAMCAAGAGSQGNYKGCAYFGEGTGRFTPQEGSNPTVGQVGGREDVPEARLEMLVSPRQVSQVLQAARSVHPYEEPAIDVVETHSMVEESAFGLVGDLPQPYDPDTFARYVMDKLGAAGLRYVAGNGPVTRVAVCGGSGGSFLPLAKAKGAQALVTGESKHDLLLDAGAWGMTYVEAGHFATENVVVQPLLEYLRQALPQVALAASKACTDGARYLTKTEDDIHWL